MIKNTSVNIAFWLLLITLVLPACNVNKYLENDEALVKKNKVKIVSEEKLVDNEEILLRLESLYKTKPNRKLFVNRAWYYFRDKEKREEVQEAGALGRYVNKNIAEEPAYYTEEAAEKTVEAMENFLFQKGFLNPEVVYKTKIKNKRSRTVYTVYPNQRFYIKSVKVTAQDSAIQYVIDSLAQYSSFQPGAILDFTKYNEEQARLNTAMKNLGYASYYQNLMGEMVVDTVGNQATIEIEVKNPVGKREQEIFRIGDIDVYLDHNSTSEGAPLYKTELENIVLRHNTPDLYVNTTTLLRALSIRKGDLYKKDELENTYKQLNKLGVYRFISIQNQVDDKDSTLLNYSIYLSPIQKWELGADGELIYSTVSDRSQIGISSKGSLSNRNLFGGAENFSSSLEAGIEIGLGGSISARLFNSYNLSWQNELRIPKLADAFGLYKALHKFNLITDRVYEKLKRNTTTKLTASVDYVDIFSYYKTNSFNFNWQYTYQPNNQHRYTINQIGVNFFNPETRELFDVILQNNPFLAASFGEQLFTGFIFRDINYIFRGTPSIKGISYGAKAFFEISGLEVYGLNSIVNAINGNKQAFTIGNVPFAHYVRLELDGRRYHQFSPRTVLAARFGIGIAVPFGNYAEVVPFVKQLDVGGGNSIRAWSQRQLGPGATVPRTLISDRSQPFFQTGNLKLEFNLEYRFDMVSRLKGAIFLDGGNVWTINDVDRPEANFSDQFLKQIALGTGFGFRFDFTYVLLRLDLGYPLRNPFPDENNNYRFDDPFSIRWVNFNLAIDYPF